VLTALVLGDATCVHEDAARALAMFTPDAIAATNNIGISWPSRIDYWCTLHPRPCPDWPGIVVAMERRRAAGLNRPQTWAHAPSEGIDRTTTDWHASSGGLCVKVLREEGFERIVLAGVPMNAEGGHFYDARPWLQAHRYQAGWTNKIKIIRPFVRSMSGWTKELLGEPSPDWIAGIAG
jgi:hypothetical protein